MGLALLLATQSACSGNAPQAGPPEMAAAPVITAKAELKTVPVEIHAIGQAQPYSTVSIEPQISGQLVGVHFREGQDVRKGDLLFTIDKKSFEASLAQTQATLAKDKAQAANSAAQAARYKQLLAQGISSREQDDQIQAQAHADAAQVAADEAMVQTMQLQLQYCEIKSPIDGRTGKLQVYPGNLVKANDVPVLVVINQIAPIYVDFSVPEQFLPDVKKYLDQGRLPVQAYTQDDTLHPETGTLTFFDNSVDSTTGTIKLRATFPNEDHRLWPGQFLNRIIHFTPKRI